MARNFLKVIDADEAHRRFREALGGPRPLPGERVPLDEAHGRVLASDQAADLDVPGFDRSNVDGFAVRARDTFGASEEGPASLRLTGEELAPGMEPTIEVGEGEATRIATGAMIPRGADAVVMVEHTEADDESVRVYRAATPGGTVSFAGSDIARGETVLRAGSRLTARETGTLAALGVTEVDVVRRPRIAVLSTGNEIIPPGAEMRPGLVHDSNLRILTDTLRELGVEAVELGVVGDDPQKLRDTIATALEGCDGVVLSGGTSKGEGDYGADAVGMLAEIVVHGVAVKPGKPLLLAVAEGRKPVVVLPGFPTSAVFTFHEFVVPVLAAMAGAPHDTASTVRARVPMRVDSAKGRAEFVLVSLLERDGGYVAYPMGKGSGSVTTFSTADGFLMLDRQEEYVEADREVEVRLLARQLRPADLVVIGSHCLGLELVLRRLRAEGFTAKTLAVGSQGGLLAASRGDCDVAGVHLCDANGVYNEPFLEDGMTLVRGYGREQGVVYRGESEPDLKTALLVNRNRGSGTRILVDEILDGARPPGYHFEARSHNAVAAAVAQGRADWGVAIRTAADAYGLGFRGLREERFDFIVPTARIERPAVGAFRRILEDDSTRAALREIGFLA